MIQRYASLVVFLLLVVLAAWFGARFEAGEWYYAISRPAWTPPDWAFAAAWSVVYVLTALAMWLGWESAHANRVGALTFWLLQLAFIAIWPWLFFGLHRVGWAMGELVLLIGLSILCTKALSAASRTAGLLMLPYVLWLLFILAFNFSIWASNGGFTV